MAELFNRDAALNAGGLRIATRSPTGGVQPTLKLTFRVERSLQRDPNKAEISIWNLRQQSRVRLQEKNIPTTLEAGYFGDTAQIFGGVLEFGSSIRQGADWVTTIQSADGGDKIASQRINVSFKGATGIGTVLQRLAGELGLGLGNVAEKASQGSLRGDVTEYLNGIVFSGNTYDQLEKVAKQMGLGISIQDGQIQLLGPTETLKPRAVLLAPTTGMIGTPEPGEDGSIKVRSLLQPNLIPGRLFEVRSAQVRGFYRVDRVVFTGDTWGDAWYSDLEGKPL